MDKTKITIKYNNKKYIYKKAKVDSSMSTAFKQKDANEFKENIKVLVKR